MKHIILITLFMSFVVLHGQDSSMATYTYQSVNHPWSEALGNHRAVLNVKSPANAISLSFDWRRADKDVDKKRFLIVNATTGDTIPNIHRVNITNEICQLNFGPVKLAGEYYFYYLPYQVQPGYGGYSKDYDEVETLPDEEWLTHIIKTKKLPTAEIARVESRSEFDSFFPMEIIATSKEKAKFEKNKPASFWLFAEDRKYPIRMKHEIPYKWMNQKNTNIHRGNAFPNEYYAFQIGVWAKNKDVKNIKYKTSGLSNGKELIPASAFTCFNIEGVDPNGKHFIKQVDIQSGSVQALWFGVDISPQQPSGVYKGTVEVSDENDQSYSVNIELNISGNAIEQRGDNEPWRHSRLRWLNSTMGISDKPTKEYEPIQVNDNKFSLLGRTITVGKTSGLPSSIQAWNNELLSSSIRLIIETEAGIKKLEATPQLLKQTSGTVVGSWTAEDIDLKLKCEATLEFDGWINYVYTVTPKREVKVKDIRLEILMKTEASPYFMGIGLQGQDTPQKYAGKWNSAEENINNFGVSVPTSKQSQWLWPFDSFWCGSAKAGIHCELRGEGYSGPLLNLYRPKFPTSWHNEGKGGFLIEKKDKETITTVYSGKRTLQTDNSLTFDFALLITPVKEINYKSQFVDRYYHNADQPAPTDDDIEAGVKVINIHHANSLNPYINYPFLRVDEMKDFTNEWHKKGCKIKVYYTIRELTNVVPEIWAIRSLGDEILQGGNGGGFPWCREHLVSDYTPQWYQRLNVEKYGVAADAAVLTATGNSRWYNYYIEGLAWLVKNLDIDGIYLDDVSFDRDMLKRMRRAMDDVKLGCMIDLHSNTGFSKGPAIQYTDFLPYVDKLWFGESFMIAKCHQQIG